MLRPCPICLSEGKKKFFRQNFGNKAIAIMDGYDVVVCQKCGFVFADNIPGQEEFNKYYEIMSKWEFNYKDGVVSEDYQKYFKKIIDFLVPHLKDKRAKIVDIGCSTGCLLNMLKEKGYVNLLGIDPSPTCVKTVKELYGIDAVADTISNFSAENKFDVIILSAVLEHLVDFSGSVDKIQSLLNEGGLLFVEVPDATRFDSYIFTPFQQFSIEHIDYFSDVSLKNLLGKFGFEIVEMQKNENTVNQTIDPDIFVLAKFSPQLKSEIVKDDITEKKLGDYISKCAQLDIEVNKFLSEVLGKHEKIIIWGVGTHTQRLVGAGLDLAKVLYFVDSNVKYHGKKINGVEIKSPREIKENAPILISTFSYQEEVARQIKDELKLKNEIVKIY
ncbi:class I SAM-dependent methyltransferase [Patescibacteria group bacterium]|nr:MAG: class I SAM-dependent methyltransferase [Patescibacteria group bacterium]